MVTPAVIASDPWWQARRKRAHSGCVDSPTHCPPTSHHHPALCCTQPALYEPLLGPLGDALAAATPLLPPLPPPGLSHALATVLRSQASLPASIPRLPGCVLRDLSPKGGMFTVLLTLLSACLQLSAGGRHLRVRAPVFLVRCAPPPGLVCVHVGAGWTVTRSAGPHTPAPARRWRGVARTKSPQPSPQEWFAPRRFGG